MSPVEVHDMAGFAAHAGGQARVVGRYVEVDVRRKRTGPPRHEGHVAIVLADGVHVALYPIWRPEALRPADERGRLVGRQVAVLATLHARAPQEPNGGASPIDPCVDEVVDVAAV